MPRFSVAFGKRKPTANIQDAPVATSSFRVLDRAEVAGTQSFDGGARLAAKMNHMPHASVSVISDDGNIFAGLTTHPNRGSASSNTTKTASTDNTSRHSNLSTAPSSADFTGEEDARPAHKATQSESSRPPPAHKNSNSGFLKNAGRSFSFGGQKKHLPALPAEEEPMPETSPPFGSTRPNGRARATTTSTATTVTPPTVDVDMNLDLGGDFSKMLLGFDKRASVLTLRNELTAGQPPASRNLTAPRPNQPTPIQTDRAAKVEPAPYSWTSQNSDDRLLTASPTVASPRAGPASGSLFPGRPVASSAPQRKPVAAGDSSVPKSSVAVPKSSVAAFGARTPSPGDQDDEEAKLLKDSLSAVNKFMKGGGVADAPSAGRKRTEDTLARGRIAASESKSKDDNLFDSSFAQAGNLARRYVARQPSPPRNKVMTPAQFERYREDRERSDSSTTMSKPSQTNEEEDEDNYDDDDDEAEKAKQAAKQRRKQEAHMTVYRQQMMKVTGESAGMAPSRPSLQVSFSTPNLLTTTGPTSQTPKSSDEEEEDEEIPLAILAAHGFPNKNRPPTRLSTMMSASNLRASQVPSYQRPGSVVGDVAGGNARLPAFAKKLPQDPFVGAGLVHNPVRESFALGGGAPPAAPAQQLPGPSVPGGLIGVIASEERSRAMRRGSPQNEGQIPAGFGPPGYDPVTGLPANMMYPGGIPTPMLSPGDQAQIHMTQQMQHFMQMQMQFMQMMAAQNSPPTSLPGMNPMATQSMGNLQTMSPSSGAYELSSPDAGMRQSTFLDGTLAGLSPADGRLQPGGMPQSSAASAWMQSVRRASYAPSVRAQGVGYAPSIAPSERSNIGLPGRYRPVSQAPPPPLPLNAAQRASTVPAGLGNWATVSKAAAGNAASSKPANTSDDDDDDRGWAAMKAKREKRKSIWKSKKGFGAEIGALIS